MAFQTPFCFVDTKPNDCKFCPSSSWSSSKITTFRLFRFEKITCGRELWVMVHFWKTSIYESQTAHTYTICIYYDSKFYDNLFAHKNVPTPPTQIFKYRFSLKCVGVIFFRPHIWIQYKILHRIICISMGLSVMRLRKGGFFWTGSFSPTQSPWVAPRIL